MPRRVYSTAAISSSSPRTARDPSVITGSCSSSITVSGIGPLAAGGGQVGHRLERVPVGGDAELVQVRAGHNPNACSSQLSRLALIWAMNCAA